MRFSAAILFVWAGVACAGEHDYYECTHADGSVGYSVTRCAKGEVQRVVEDDTAPVTRSLGEASSVSQVVAGSGGHFHGIGAINGVSVPMMVDTGATDVSLSAAMAQKLGLKLQSGRMGTGMTANGAIPVVVITVDSVTFAGKTRKDVQVDVRMGQQDSIVLLGMSFLRHFEMNIDGDVLSLREK